MDRVSMSNAGLAAALVSAATFGTSGSFATSLIATGWTPGAVVIARVAIAAIVLTIPAVWQLRRHLAAGGRGGLRSALFYGIVAVAGAQLCYFNAVDHLSVAVALLLEYSGILLVVGWTWFRHGHRPRRPTIAGAVLAVAGLVLVLDLAGSHHVDGVGVAWSFGAAVGLAVYFVVSSGTDDALPPLVVAWSGLAIGSLALVLAAAVGVLPVHTSSAPVTLLHTRTTWLVPVLGLAVVAAVIAYVAGISAARRLGARLASFVGLTEVLFAVAFAWLLLGQRLDAMQGFGALLVIGGIALVRADELRVSPPARPDSGRGVGVPLLVAGEVPVREDAVDAQACASA